MKTFFLLTLLLSSSILTARTPQEINLLPDEKNTVEVYEKYAQSVVNITTVQKVSTGFWDNRPMQKGSGSGFIWDKKGHIITNYHVIKGGTKFIITFKGDKKEYHAQVVGGSERKDLAVLKLTHRPTNIFPVKLGDSSQVRPGQKAMAIGNPFRFHHSISVGIISAVDRILPGVAGGVSIRKMLQTDASINPGNSGGPLLNSAGEVMGICTAIYSKIGESSGIGLALPINTAKKVASDIIKFGKVIRPGLGIGLLEDAFNVRVLAALKKHSTGLVIRYIDPKGPAAQAGLKGIEEDAFGKLYLGDIITEIKTQKGRKKINNYDDIYHALEDAKVDEEISVTYIKVHSALSTPDAQQKKYPSKVIKVKLRALE